MDTASASAAAVPAWLPGWLEKGWNLLAEYPWLLALIILVVGLALAFLIRAFILYWGLKITTRTNAELMARLVRIGAGVAGLVTAYIMLVTALHTLPLSDTVISVVTRVLVSLLILQLIRGRRLRPAMWPWKCWAGSRTASPWSKSAPCPCST